MSIMRRYLRLGRRKKAVPANPSEPEIMPSTSPDRIRRGSAAVALQSQLDTNLDSLAMDPPVAGKGTASPNTVTPVQRRRPSMKIDDEEARRVNELIKATMNGGLGGAVKERRQSEGFVKPANSDLANDLAEKAQERNDEAQRINESIASGLGKHRERRKSTEGTTKPDDEDPAPKSAFMSSRPPRELRKSKEGTPQQSADAAAKDSSPDKDDAPFRERKRSIVANAETMAAAEAASGYGGAREALLHQESFTGDDIQWLDKALKQVAALNARAESAFDAMMAQNDSFNDKNPAKTAEERARSAAEAAQAAVHAAKDAAKAAKVAKARQALEAKTAKRVVKVVNHPKSGEARASIRQALGRIALFEDVSDEDMTRLVDAFEERSATADETIINQGDAGFYFYIILSGEFIVLLNQRGNRVPVHTYPRGGSFGELALLYDKPRAASIKCSKPGILYQLDRDTFMDIVT